MGRAHNHAGDSGRAALRCARTRLDRCFGPELARLSPRDRYQRGDLGRQLLGRLGVSLPVQPWERERARELLGGDYEAVHKRGLGSVMGADGVPTVASIRERLLSLANDRGLHADDLDQARQDHDSDAATIRTAELDWLAEHLALPVTQQGDESAAEARRRALLDLWFDGPSR